MKYKQKPRYVEAVQFDGYNKQEIDQFTGQNCPMVGGKLAVDIGYKNAIVPQDGYVVKDHAGFSVWSKETFEASYEPDFGNREITLPLSMDGESIHIGDMMTAADEQCYKVLAVSGNCIVIDHEDEGLTLRLASAWVHCLSKPQNENGS